MSHECKTFNQPYEPVLRKLNCKQVLQIAVSVCAHAQWSEEADGVGLTSLKELDVS